MSIVSFEAKGASTPVLGKYKKALTEVSKAEAFALCKLFECTQQVTKKSSRHELMKFLLINQPDFKHEPSTISAFFEVTNLGFDRFGVTAFSSTEINEADFEDVRICKGPKVNIELIIADINAMTAGDEEEEIVDQMNLGGEEEEDLDVKQEGSNAARSRRNKVFQPSLKQIKYEEDEGTEIFISKIEAFCLGNEITSDKEKIRFADHIPGTIF